MKWNTNDAVYVYNATTIGMAVTGSFFGAFWGLQLAKRAPTKLEKGLYYALAPLWGGAVGCLLGVASPLLIYAFALTGVVYVVDAVA